MKEKVEMIQTPIKLAWQTKMISISRYMFHPNSSGIVPVKTTGELATAGYFEEAAGFLPSEGEVLQLQLLGATQPATAVGTRVRVQIRGLDEPESWSVSSGLGSSSMV